MAKANLKNQTVELSLEELAALLGMVNQEFKKQPEKPAKAPKKTAKTPKKAAKKQTKKAAEKPKETSKKKHYEVQTAEKNHLTAGQKRRLNNAVKNCKEAGFEAHWVVVGTWAWVYCDDGRGRTEEFKSVKQAKGWKHSPRRGAFVDKSFI